MPLSRKKAKKSTSASKRVVQMALVEMPMDIIFEIFGYLDPLDLLQLARTTKTLRAILMNRSSLPLWKRVRHAYYQMPDGPEGMSEPQYVSLALDRICYGCGVSNHSVRTFWNAQLNSCGGPRGCESALLVNRSNLREFDLHKALPSWLVRLLEDYYTDLYSIKQAQIWLKEYASLSSSSANLKSKLEWESQITEKHALTKKHIESFCSWSFVREREIIAERSRLMKANNEALLVKLEELGWGEEISKMSPYDRSNMYSTLSIHPELESFPLVWSSNRTAILKALKAIKTARIEREWQMLLSLRYSVLEEIYDEYIRELPPDALIPNIADIALFPPVHSILTDERTTLIVNRQTFEDLNFMQKLPSIVSDWKIRLDDELIRMAQIKLSEPFTKDQLLLATTIFYCDACHMDLFYPQVLVHPCSSPWNSSGNIKFNRDVHHAAIDIINVLGLDPKTVTVDDMTIRNSVLQCLNCRTTRLGRMTMFWSRVFEHSRKDHKCLPSMLSWKVPGHDDQLKLQASLAQELAKSDRQGSSARPRFMCGVCRQKLTLVELNRHLSEAHGIRNPGEHDILLHPNAIHTPMPCVLPEADYHLSAM